MSKIVIDAREYSTTTGRYVRHLLEQLQALDNANSYTVLLYPKDMDKWNPTASNFTKLVCPYKEFTFAEQLGLWRQLKGLHADLVHFPMVQQPLLYRGKVVTTMNDLTTLRFRNPTKNAFVFWAKQRVYWLVNYFVAHKSAAILTYSNFVGEDVMHFAKLPSTKFTTTHLAADYLPEQTHAVEGLEGKDFIMYVGRPLPHKNLGRLIEAFELLQKTRPNLHLVLAGKKDDMYAIHEKTVQQRGIQNVVFTGFIDDAQLRWLYENCKAYAFPSLSEGFGLPGLEAMLHGAPVVSSNASSLPEVNGDAALYFNPLDVHDMAEKIGQVVDDPELRADLIERGKEQAAKFSWERMAKQTLAVYERTLHG